jgi:hypothetical protein
MSSLRNITREPTPNLQNIELQKAYHIASGGNNFGYPMYQDEING